MGRVGGNVGRLPGGFPALEYARHPSDHGCLETSIEYCPCGTATQSVGTTDRSLQKALVATAKSGKRMVFSMNVIDGWGSHVYNYPEFV